MIRQLHPKYGELEPLKGAYLQLGLHQKAAVGQVFIYANYISSLDGRISLLNQQSGEYEVPKAMANPRDWRLYQELAGQSDVMITSARYFRQLAIGQAQDLLPVGVSPDFSDIKTWREQQALKAQPDVVVLSNSLDIPLDAVCSLSDRKVIVFTKSQTHLEKVKVLEDVGVQVIQADDEVSGHFIRATLEQLGYRSAYMIAGPQVHQTLLRDECIDELFLTAHFSLLGGKSFHAVLDDEVPATAMKLTALYLDENAGQMFMRYHYDKRG